MRSADVTGAASGADGRTKRRRYADPDRRRLTRRGLLGLPALLFVGVFLLYPLALLIETSFQAKTGEWSLEQYARIATTPVYGLIVWKTAWIAGLVTLIDFLVGYPFAVALSRARGWWRLVLLAAILMPFWTNLLVRAYGWIVILHPNGLVNMLLIRLGLISEPIELVQNTTGVLIGMVQIMLPYMVLPIAAQIGKMDRRLLNAARSLGASAPRTFLHVYFPLTLPGVFAGALVTLVLSLGFFVIPALLGGRRDVLIAQLIDFNLTKVLNWEFAAALGTLLLVATMGLFLAAQRWFRLESLWTEAR
ncbi:MAG TPA: ABC transporter permease [Stellaceae bacterium]|nr:ABC transporter permease [Stellaceae bacterium]